VHVTLLIGFRNSQAVQLVFQKANWLIREAMKNNGTLIRIDLDFKNAFQSALSQQATRVYGPYRKGLGSLTTGCSKTSYLMYFIRFKTDRIVCPKYPRMVLKRIRIRSVEETARYHYRVCFGVPLLNLVPRNQRLGWLM